MNAMRPLNDFQKWLVDNNIKQGSVVLEVGVGAGEMNAYLEKRCIKLYATDYDHSVLSRAGLKTEKFITDMDQNKDFDIQFIPDNSLDAVVIFEVLEHLRYPEFAIKALRRKLKPDGVLIASTPNDAWFWHRWMYLRGKTKYDISQTNHYQFWNVYQFEKVFDNSDWRWQKTYFERAYPWFKRSIYRPKNYLPGRSWLDNFFVYDQAVVAHRNEENKDVRS